MMPKKWETISTEISVSCGVQGCDQTATCYCAESEDGREIGETYYCPKHAAIADVMHGDYAAS